MRRSIPMERTDNSSRERSHSSGRTTRGRTCGRAPPPSRRRVWPGSEPAVTACGSPGGGTAVPACGLHRVRRARRRGRRRAGPSVSTPRSGTSRPARHFVRDPEAAHVTASGEGVVPVAGVRPGEITTVIHVGGRPRGDHRRPPGRRGNRAEGRRREPERRRARGHGARRGSAPSVLVGSAGTRRGSPAARIRDEVRGTESRSGSGRPCRGRAGEPAREPKDARPPAGPVRR